MDTSKLDYDDVKKQLEELAKDTDTAAVTRKRALNAMLILDTIDATLRRDAMRRARDGIKQAGDPTGALPLT